MSGVQITTSRVQELWRDRPRSRVLHATLWALTIWTIYAWLSPEIGLLEFLDSRRFSNLGRFAEKELVPFPLREENFSLRILTDWILDIWNRIGLESTLATLQISIIATVLAGAAALPLSMVAARNVSTSTPFENGHHVGPAALRILWAVVTSAARASAILMRAVPEFILAFLLLAVLGPRNAWPAILALAIHNCGILARLGSEVVENLEPAPLRSLAAVGAPRRSLVIFGVLPLALGRDLLYFFYRFETCVREATVLGMLGVLSLGYWIQDARAKQYYDEVFLLVLFSVGLVLVADLVSVLARRSIRR
jgi:phosphonate transport system permease protein